MALENKILGGKKILIGDDAGAKNVLLLRVEGLRGSDEIGGETAGEEIAGRAGRQNEDGEDQNSANQAGLRPADSRGRRSAHGLSDTAHIFSDW